MTVLSRTHRMRPPSSGGGALGFTANAGWTVTGTVGVDGEVLTLTRAAGGLSIPTDPRPDYWAPMESSVAKDSTYSKSTSPSLILQTNASFQSTIKPANAAGALDQLFLSVSGNQPGSAGPLDADTNFFSSSGGATPSWTVANGKHYINIKLYRDYNSDGVINGKVFRNWYSAVVGGNTNIYIVEGTGYLCNLENTSVLPDDLKGDNHEYGASGFPHPQNAWFTDEYVMKESSSNTIDGFLDYCRNGNWAYGAAHRQMNTRPTDADHLKTLGFFSQYSVNGVPPNNGHEYIAHIYNNSSGLFHVVLSTESTYGNVNLGATNPGINREPLLPVSGSGSSTGVQVAQRRGAYSAYNGLYMYLIDDNYVVHAPGRYDP